MQPIEPAQTPTYAPEVLPVPVEEVSTKPLDPFFPDALTTTDPPIQYRGVIPSYPNPQPPVIYGPGGLNSEPIPTYDQEVAPVPIEAAPTAPLDPTLYARELQDQESSPVPPLGPAMDFFDPMVEFLPEFRRLHQSHVDKIVIANQVDQMITIYVHNFLDMKLQTAILILFNGSLALVWLLSLLTDVT